MISLSPSTIRTSSSGATLARRFPSRSVESVLICPIFTQDRFGSFTDRSSRVSGNPAEGSIEVTASAITVPERWLKMSSLTTSTGLCPACSWPRAGSRSAQAMSPLSMRATPAPSPTNSQLRPVLLQALVWRTQRLAECALGERACRALLPELAGSGSLRLRGAQARRALQGRSGQSKLRSWRLAWRYSITRGSTVATVLRRLTIRCIGRAPFAAWGGRVDSASIRRREKRFRS
jgi:hypothetical protein